MKNIQLVQLSPDELVSLINKGVRQQLEHLKVELLNRRDRDELLNRQDASAMLDIDLSTLARWTNSGKLNAYGIAGRRYYKRAEILESLKQSNNTRTKTQ